MVYSIVNVTRRYDGKVDGNWMQDCIGTLDDALDRAARAKEVNGGRIDVAVTEPINSPVPMLSYWTGLKLAGSPKEN